MTSPNRDAFLGLKALPGCNHRPLVRLLTAGYKACPECAGYYLESLANVVAYFDITDGPLNEQATAFGLRRQENPTPTENQTPIESGG